MALWSFQCGLWVDRCVFFRCWRQHTSSQAFHKLWETAGFSKFGQMFSPETESKFPAWTYKLKVYAALWGQRIMLHISRVWSGKSLSKLSTLSPFVDYGKCNYFLSIRQHNQLIPRQSHYIPDCQMSNRNLYYLYSCLLSCMAPESIVTSLVPFMGEMTLMFSNKLSWYLWGSLSCTSGHEWLKVQFNI